MTREEKVTLFLLLIDIRNELGSKPGVKSVAQMQRLKDVDKALRVIMKSMRIKGG